LLNRIFLRTKALAKLLNVSVSVLEKARSTKVGEFATLPYIKVGRVVLYDAQTVEGWLARQQAPANKKKP
jgi:hypothetical protein